MIEWSLASERYLINVLRWSTCDEEQTAAFYYLKERITQVAGRIIYKAYPKLYPDLELIVDDLISKLRAYNPEVYGNSLQYRKLIKLFTERNCQNRLRKMRGDKAADVVSVSDYDETLSTENTTMFMSTSSSLPRPEDALSERGKKVVLFRAIADLKEPDIEVFVLSVYAGWPTKKIAAHKKRTDEAIRQQLFRCKRNIVNFGKIHMLHDSMVKMERETAEKIARFSPEIQNLLNELRQIYDLFD